MDKSDLIKRINQTKKMDKKKLTKQLEAYILEAGK